MELQERRRYARHEVVIAAMLAPNGIEHFAYVMDLSEGGACVGLCEGWTPAAGMPIRVLFQLNETDIVTLRAQVTRVCADHMGVEFAPTQEAGIERLLHDFGLLH